jgi:hypothetical protein
LVEYGLFRFVAAPILMDKVLIPLITSAQKKAKPAPIKYTDPVEESQRRLRETLKE